MHIQGVRVLVVEDDPILGDLWVDILQDAGAEVVGPCATVHHALAHIATCPPLVATLDIELLDGESFPIARALMGLNTPFVFVSSRDSADMPAEFAGHAYLRKPVAVRDLLAALGEC